MEMLFLYSPAIVNPELLIIHCQCSEILPELAFVLLLPVEPSFIPPVMDVAASALLDDSM